MVMVMVMAGSIEVKFIMENEERWLCGFEMEFALYEVDGIVLDSE